MSLWAPRATKKYRVEHAPPSLERTAHMSDVVRDLPAPENKRYYPALDGLRAIAVILVFCEHYVYHPSVLRWGWIGVDIFFVLSGFLITGILYDTRNTQHRFRNFYVRRVLRIFPLYYGILLLALLLNPIFHWIWWPAWRLWLAYLGNYVRVLYPATFSATGVGLLDLHPTLGLHHLPALQLRHFWSLCVEEQFYLFWPLVVFTIRNRVHLRNLCLASVIVTPFLRLICTLVLPAPFLARQFLYQFTPLRIDALLLGGLLALCLRGPEAARIARLARPVAFAMVATFVVIQAGFFLFTHSLASPDSSSYSISTFGYSGIDLFGAAIILLAINPCTLTYRILHRPSLRRLGQISYGFYVFHNIPHDLYEQIGKRMAGGSYFAAQCFTIVLAFLSTLVISYLSFRFFETPFLRLKDRFTAFEPEPSLPR